MAAGFPAPVVADIPANGIIDAGADPRLRNAAYFYFPTDLKEGLLHSWNVAYQRELRLATSPAKSPTSATTARTSSSAST